MIPALRLAPDSPPPPIHSGGSNGFQMCLGGAETPSEVRMDETIRVRRAGALLQNHIRWFLRIYVFISLNGREDPVNLQII